MRKTIILPLLLAVAACSNQSANPLAAAQQALAEQNLNGARFQLVAALRGDPDNAAMLDLLADVQLRMGDGVAARSTLEQLAAAGGKGLRFDQLSAEMLLRTDRPEEALARLGNDAAPESLRIRAAALLVLEDPAGAMALWRQGRADGVTAANLRLAFDEGSYLAETGDLAGARQIETAMVAADKDAFETRMLGGKVALLSGDAAAAQDRFGAAAKAFRHRIEPVCGQAEAMDMAGALKAALDLLSDADARMPGQPCVGTIRLSLLAQQGEWGKIRDLLQDRESALDPSSSEGLTYAEAVMRLGRPEQARAMFTKALLVAPQNPYARLMLGEAQLATGDTAAAAATLAPLAKSVLAGEHELQLAQRAASAAGLPNDASGYAMRLSSGSWRTAQATNARGLAAVARQDWAVAIAAWQELLASGFDTEVQRRLAFALSRAGRHGEAITAADKLLAAQPENPDAAYLAGQVRINGNIDRAKGLALLEQAVARQPRNWLFKQALANAKAAAG